METRIRPAAMSATVWSPCVNAVRAAVSSASPASAGSVAATCTASPSVSDAPAGASPSSLRYIPVARDPSRATPIAPPSSYAVSEIADAEPARSAGAAARTASLVTVCARPAPAPMRTEAPTTTSAPSSTPTNAIAANPVMTSARPPTMVRAMPIRSDSRTASRPAATDIAISGSSSSPACIGENPSTSWRYCVSRNSEEIIAKTIVKFVASEALKRLMPNRFRSSSGCSRRRWRRTNRTAMTIPNPIAARAVHETPFSAMVLTP
nr:hypothetical protein GCM10025732_29460 [Glycomyces mayteni]